MSVEVHRARSHLGQSITATAALIAASVAVAALVLSGDPAYGQERSTDVSADVRIAAQRLEDGSIRFGLRTQAATGEWMEPVTPHVHRFDPSMVRIGHWLFSSPLMLIIEESRDGKLLQLAQSAEPAAQHGRTELRIGAQLREDGRVEFSVQQRTDGGWSSHILPRVRTMSAAGDPTSWLSSSQVSITIADVSTQPPIEREAPKVSRQSPITPVLRRGVLTDTLEYVAALGSSAQLESLVTVHSEQGTSLQVGCLGESRTVQLRGSHSRPIGAAVDGAQLEVRWSPATDDGSVVFRAADPDWMLERLQRGQSLTVTYDQKTANDVTFGLSGIFKTPIQTNIVHCGNYRQPSWRPVIDPQYGITDAGAIYFLDQPDVTEVLGRTHVRIEGSSEATGTDGRPIILSATCRHGNLSFSVGNLPTVDGPFAFVVVSMEASGLTRPGAS